MAIDRVHAAATAAGKVRMDIVTGTAPAVRSREQGAQLVVYNLTHTLMEHLAALRTPGGAPC